jgi:hypothetical protein
VRGILDSSREPAWKSPHLLTSQTMPFSTSEYHVEHPVGGQITMRLDAWHRFILNKSIQRVFEVCIRP